MVKLFEMKTRQNLYVCSFR